MGYYGGFGGALGDAWLLSLSLALASSFLRGVDVECCGGLFLILALD